MATYTPKESTPAKEEDSFYADFNLASWYARILKGDTFDANLQTKKDYAFSNFDPNRGELAGTNSDGWAMDELLGLPFVDHIREGGISNSISLSSPFEVDYDYGYDNQNLYMKLPETGGNNSMIQGFSDEERAQYQDLMDRGRFIDSSDGNAGPGEYTMIWIEDPPEQSSWSQFLSNPAVNIMAAIIPGGAQAIAGLKAVSGETMHASDWFAFAGGYDVVGQKFGEFAANMGDAASAAVGGSEFLAKAVTAGTKNAIAALITDQDPLEAFLTGGAQVAVGRILGEVNELTGGALDSLEEIGVFTDDTRVYGDDGKVISGSASQSVGKIARSMIQEAVASQLATGDINEARMAQIVSSAVITTDTLKGFVGEKLPSGGIQMITTSLQSSLNAAILGGDVSDAFLNSLAAQLERSVRQSLNNGTFGEDFAEFWDRASGKYGILTEQALVADGAATARAEAAKEVNEVNNLINDGAEKLTALSKTVNDANDAMGGGYGAGATIEEIDAYEAALAAYEDYEAEFTDTLNNDYIPRIDSGTETYNKATDAYNTAADLYQSTYDGLSDGGDEYDSGFADALANINEATVNNLSPDFDAEFYAEQNGITKEEAYNHYLAKGLFSNLPSNQTTLTAQNSAAVNSVINAAAKTIGLDASQLTDAQRKTISEKLTTMAGSGSISDIPEQNAVQGLLSSINNPDGTGEEFFKATQNNDGSWDYEYSSTSSTFGKAEGVTNADIRDGKAELVIDSDTGQRVWTNVPTESHWNEHLGDIVQTDSESGEQFYMDADGNRMNLLDIPDVDMDAVNNANPNIGVGNETLQDLAENDPQAFTDVVNDNNLSDTNTGSTAANWFLQALADGATYLQGNEDTPPASEAAQNAYANGIRATAGIIEAFNGFSIAFGSDPAGTAAGKFAADMAKIGEGANTAGYQEAVGGMREFQAGLERKDDPNTPIVYDENGEYVSGDESKKSLWEGAQGIFKTAGNHPAAFFGEYISVEFMQEAAPLLVGSLATILARGAAKGLGAGLTKELSQEAAQAIGRKAGLTAAAATDVAEAWGGTAGGAYEQGHATFMKMAGKEADILELSGPARDAFLAAQDIKAREYALNLAINAGNVAGVMVVGSLAVGGMALEKLFINGKPPAEFGGLYNEIARRLSEGATITIKEGVTESFEEGAATAYTSGQLSLIDPDIDVMGDVGAAAAMGALVGGTVSGGIYSISSTGDFVSDLLISNNPDALELLNNSENYSQEELQTKLNNFLGDPQVATDAMNFLYDEVYTSTAEAVDALEALGLPYTPEDVNNIVGSTSDADLDNKLASYWAMTYGNKDDGSNTNVVTNDDGSVTTTNDDGSSSTVDSGGNLISSTDIDGDTTTIDANGGSTTTDADGNLISSTDGSGNTTTFNADGTSNVTDVNGNTTNYDADGNVVNDKDDGSNTNVVTNDDGSVTTTNDDGSSSTVDSGGNLISSTDIDGDTTTIDANGGSTTTDADGNLISSTDGSGNTTTFNADGTSNVTDVNGNTTNYDADGNVVNNDGSGRSIVTNDDGTVTITDSTGTTNYDADGNLISSTDVNGNTTTTNDDGSSSTVDSGGNLISSTDVNGNTTTTATTTTDVNGNTTNTTNNTTPINNNGLNSDAVAAMLDDSIGTPATDGEPATGLYAELEALGLNDQQILTFIGTPAGLDAEGNVIPATGLYNEITNVNGNITASKEEVLSAIGNPATDTDAATGVFAALDTQTGDILSGTQGQINTQTGDILSGTQGQINTTQTAIINQAAEFERTGMARDAAIQAAVNQISVDLGLTKQEILNQIGITEANLSTQIGSGIDQITGDLDLIAKYVGKSATEVTQTDIDFVADVIAQQEVLTDPTSFVATDKQLQYDVNNDGVIDTNDQILLEQAFSGQDATLGDMFDATGLYAYNDAIAAQQKLEAEEQFETEQELEQQRQFEIQTQIDQNQRLNKFDDEIRRAAEMQAAQPTVATTNKMGLAKIGPQYQFDTIFANQQQEQAYGTPFGGYGPSSSPLGQSPFGVRKASGGIIKDSTDRLLKIIGED